MEKMAQMAQISKEKNKIQIAKIYDKFQQVAKNIERF